MLSCGARMLCGDWRRPADGPLLEDRSERSALYFPPPAVTNKTVCGWLTGGVAAGALAAPSLHLPPPVKPVDDGGVPVWTPRVVVAPVRIASSGRGATRVPLWGPPSEAELEIFAAQLSTDEQVRSGLLAQLRGVVSRGTEGLGPIMRGIRTMAVARADALRGGTGDVSWDQAIELNERRADALRQLQAIESDLEATVRTTLAGPTSQPLSDREEAAIIAWRAARARVRFAEVLREPESARVDLGRLAQAVAGSDVPVDSPLGRCIAGYWEQITPMCLRFLSDEPVLSARATKAEKTWATARDPETAAAGRNSFFQAGKAETQLVRPIIRTNREWLSRFQEAMAPDIGRRFIATAALAMYPNMSPEPGHVRAALVNVLSDPSLLPHQAQSLEAVMSRLTMELAKADSALMDAFDEEYLTSRDPGAPLASVRAERQANMERLEAERWGSCLGALAAAKALLLDEQLADAGVGELLVGDGFSVPRRRKHGASELADDESLMLPVIGPDGKVDRAAPPIRPPRPPRTVAD